MKFHLEEMTLEACRGYTFVKTYIQLTKNSVDLAFSENIH